MIAITGASGLLGHALCHSLSLKYEVSGLRNHHAVDLPVHSPVRRFRQFRVDLENEFRAWCSEHRPDVVIHCAGVTDVDRCEREPEYARHGNVTLTQAVSQAAQSVGAKLVHISTDHLWDGKKPLVQEDTPISPINQYAKTKAQAEEVVLKNHDALILRTNFFGKGPAWRKSFSDWILERCHSGATATLFDDVFVTPFEVSYLSESMEQLLNLKAVGVFHLCGSERISKYDLGTRIARAHGFDADAIFTRGKLANAELSAPRPQDMSLSVKKAEKFLGHALPTIDQSIERLKRNQSS